MEEILILAHDYVVFHHGLLPDLVVGSFLKTKFKHMPGFMALSRKPAREGHRQLIVHEKLHVVWTTK